MDLTLSKQTTEVQKMYKVGGVIMRGKDNPCYGCTEATGRAYNCHTLCDGYKQFQDDCKEEKNVIKRKNPYYKSLSKEKFMKRNALNRNRRRRK